MRLLKIFIVLLVMTNLCYGDILLFRYYDTATGEERGICYSDINGNSPISNPSWSIEIIKETQMDYYMDLHRKQLKDKQKAYDTNLKNKKKDIKDKLKAIAGISFTDEEIDIMLGDK